MKLSLQFLVSLTVAGLQAVPVSEPDPHHQPAPAHPLPPPQPASKIIASAPTVLCNLEYSTTFFTDYKEVEVEECHTEYEKLCVTETNVVCVASSVTQCDLVTKAQCHTEYSAQCRDHVKLELEPYIETVCSTQYTEECEHRWEGEGNDKVWVPIPGTCRQEPHEACADVAKTKERQVTYPVCEDVPHQVCVDVPSEVCHEIPDQKCAEKPYEKCREEPRETCIKVHKKVPVKATKKIPKQRCVHTDGYQEPGQPQIPSSPLPYPPGPAPAPAVVAPPVAVLPPASVNSPKFVAVPANPAVPVPALPLNPRGLGRVAKSADIEQDNSEDEEKDTGEDEDVPLVDNNVPEEATADSEFTNRNLRRVRLRVARPRAASSAEDEVEVTTVAAT